MEKPNLLHQFASYNCLFTLSSITQKQIDDRTFLGAPLVNIIASSKGISQPYLVGQVPAGLKGEAREEFGRKIRRDPDYEKSLDILGRDHDIFFENVNITSVPSPNNERNLADVAKITFELHEPFGVTFIEKLRGAAFLAKFQDYQAAPFLLTIEFKGYNSDGSVHKTKVPQRRIPIFITRVEFDVSEAGARYNVIAVPYQDMAYDDSFKFARTSTQIETNSLSEWVNKLEFTLNETQMKEEEENNPPLRTPGYRDRYKFRVSPDLSALIGDRINVADQATARSDDTSDSVKFNEMSEQDQMVQIGGYGTIEAPAPRPKTVGSIITPNLSLTKAFEDIIRSTDYFQNLVENFFTTYLGGVTEDEAVSIFTEESRRAELVDYINKNQFVTWFKIKANIKTLTDLGIDPITKMHPKEISYVAVPQKISVHKFLMPGQVLPGTKLEDAAVKKYNYLYTGENLDIQNLSINYKVAYFHRNVKGENKTDTENTLLSRIGQLKNKIFGNDPNRKNEKTEKRILDLRSYPSTLKSKSSAERIASLSEKNQEFFDYLTNPEADMMRIELTILGDPAFIAQDIFTPLGDEISADRTFDRDEPYDNFWESFNLDQYMPLISLKYRFPTDLSERKGAMFFDKQTKEQQLFFSGVYQVARIESSMDQGQFTQVLTCVRLNNQSAEGESINSYNSFTKEGSVNTKISGQEILRNFQTGRYWNVFKF